MTKIKRRIMKSGYIITVDVTIIHTNFQLKL